MKRVDACATGDRIAAAIAPQAIIAQQPIDEIIAGIAMMAVVPGRPGIGAEGVIDEVRQLDVGNGAGCELDHIVRAAQRQVAVAVDDQHCLRAAACANPAPPHLDKARAKVRPRQRRAIIIERRRQFAPEHQRHIGVAIGTVDIGIELQLQLVALDPAEIGNDMGCRQTARRIARSSKAKHISARATRGCIPCIDFCADIDRIITCTTVDDIDAAVAAYGVIACATLDCVIAIATANVIIAITAIERIGACKTHNIIGTSAATDTIIALATIERVVARAAGQLVIADATVQIATRRACGHHIVASLAIQRVRPRTARHHIVASAPIERVVACIPVQRVIPSIAVQRVIVVAAP